jgi:hypothetical protein
MQRSSTIQESKTALPTLCPGDNLIKIMVGDRTKVG